MNPMGAKMELCPYWARMAPENLWRRGLHRCLSAGATREKAGGGLARANVPKSAGPLVGPTGRGRLPVRTPRNI